MSITSIAFDTIIRGMRLCKQAEELEGEFVNQFGLAV